MRILFLLFFSISTWAQVKVVTTTTNLRSIVEFIGGDKVEVVSLAKGSQDPHYLEAKPSYVLKVSKADLLFQIGLGLEDAWLPLIIRGARRPDLRPGEKGHLFAHEGIDLLEVLKNGEFSRKDGDVHPEGNPHFMLDPNRAAQVAMKLAEKLGKIDAKNQAFYKKRAEEFQVKVNELNAKKLKGMKVISYHKTLNYFYQRFRIKNIAYLEPKPGVPPSAAHIFKLVKKVKKQKPEKIVIENYFDPSVGERLKKEESSLKVLQVPVAVEANNKVKDILSLYKYLIKELEK